MSQTMVGLVFFLTWKGILNLKKRATYLKKVMNFFSFFLLILFCNPYQPVSIIYIRLLSLSWIKSKCSFVIVLYMKYLYCNTMVQITGRIFSSYVETSSLKKRGKVNRESIQVNIFFIKDFWWLENLDHNNVPVCWNLF